MAHREFAEREEIRKRDAEVRPGAARRFVRSERTVEPTLVLVEIAEVVEDFVGLGRDSARRLELRDRAVDVAPLREGVGEIDTGGERQRIERERPAVRRDAFVDSGEARERDTEVRPRPRIVRRLRERLAQIRVGGIGLPLFERACAEPRPNCGRGRSALGERRQ